jgi:hypothetical protein
MSSSSNIQKPVEVKQTGQQPAEIVKKAGKILDKVVVEVKNQASKKEWQIAALVAGLVILGIGAFGAAGLLNSYGHLAMPQGLSSFVNTIGNSGLLAATVLGAAVGGALIGFGIYGVSKSRKEKIELVPLEQVVQQLRKEQALVREEERKKERVPKGQLNELQDLLNKKPNLSPEAQNPYEKSVQTMQQEQVILEKAITEITEKNGLQKAVRDPSKSNAMTYSLQQMGRNGQLIGVMVTINTPSHELSFLTNADGINKIKGVLTEQGYSKEKTTTEKEKTNSFDRPVPINPNSVKKFFNA